MYNDLANLLDIVNIYYPAEIDLDDLNELHKSEKFDKLRTICLEAGSNNTWMEFLKIIENNLDVSIRDHTLLFNSNPSFTASIIADKNEQCKLILKVSVIAPVYSLYFDNLADNHNKRFIRSNPVTSFEEVVFKKINAEFAKYFIDYNILNFSYNFNIISYLGNVKVNRRKPYLDELIFGPNMSIHPY